MTFIAPNLSIMVGASVAAKLMGQYSHTGTVLKTKGLELSELPAVIRDERLFTPDMVILIFKVVCWGFYPGTQLALPPPHSPPLTPGGKGYSASQLFIVNFQIVIKIITVGLTYFCTQL